MKNKCRCYLKKRTLNVEGVMFYALQKQVLFLRWCFNMFLMSD